MKKSKIKTRTQTNKRRQLRFEIEERKTIKIRNPDIPILYVARYALI